MKVANKYVNQSIPSSDNQKFVPSWTLHYMLQGLQLHILYIAGKDSIPTWKSKLEVTKRVKKNLLTLLSSGSKITDSMQVVHTLLSIVEEWGGEIWLHLWYACQLSISNNITVVNFWKNKVNTKPHNVALFSDDRGLHQSCLQDQTFKQDWK